MVKHPFEIIVELIVGIIVQTADHIGFILGKLFELFQSIVIYLGGNIMALFISSSIVVAIVIALRKEIFSSVKLIIISTAVLVGILVLLLTVFSRIF